jgi:hypothetical protein
MIQKKDFAVRLSFIIFLTLLTVNLFIPKLCLAKSAVLSYAVMDSENEKSDYGVVFNMITYHKNRFAIGFDIGLYNWGSTVNLGFPGVPALNIDVDLLRASTNFMYRLFEFNKKAGKDNSVMRDGFYIEAGPSYYNMEISSGGISVDDSSTNFYYGLTLKASNIFLKFKKHEAEFDGVEFDSEEYSLGYMFNF